MLNDEQTINGIGLSFNGLRNSPFDHSSDRNVQIPCLILEKVERPLMAQSGQPGDFIDRLAVVAR